ncbi:unnamed protein product [Mytilus edulis]|uniref:Uncharacterized protein n=1 Tax=Mytilus edulis TaxID=6550 RepID=A0A8S3RZ43_MYTED|nr:unnamed protein product [Mytilus edulis]
MTDLQTRVMRSRFIIFIADFRLVGRHYCAVWDTIQVYLSWTTTLANPVQTHLYACKKLHLFTINPHSEYRQNCKGPKIIAPGSKYIWQPNFNRGECDEERYQPFIFRTEGYTNCSFMKSRCYSEGQATFSNGSAKTDRQCYCDSNRGYVFVSSTHENYCLPSENDCSCYKNVTESITKTYKTGWYNAEYTTNLPNVQSEIMTDVHTVRDYDDHRYNIRRNENENGSKDAALVVLVMLILMFIIPYHFNRSAEHTRMVNREEEQTLDKIVLHQNMLTGTEKCVLLRYMSTLSNIEIIEFALILQKKEMCDKYIVLVALTFDALANKSNEVDPEDKLFKEIENIISWSSCPDLSRCMLYGRKAVRLSFKGKQAEGEVMVIKARECADKFEPCLETVDLYYKIVLFRRAWYENSPEDELMSIMDCTNIARDLLTGMSDDLRLFWSRRFVVRLLFCYLGLGMRCRFIPGYQIRPEYIQKSEDLLKLF